jgi:hypothetical protein
MINSYSTLRTSCSMLDSRQSNLPLPAGLRMNGAPPGTSTVPSKKPGSTTPGLKNVLAVSKDEIVRRKGRGLLPRVPRIVPLVLTPQKRVGLLSSTPDWSWTTLNRPTSLNQERHR